MNIFAFKKYKIKYMITKELKKNLVKFFLANQYKNFKSNKIIKFIYRNKYYYKYYFKFFKDLLNYRFLFKNSSFSR